MKGVKGKLGVVLAAAALSVSVACAGYGAADDPLQKVVREHRAAAAERETERLEGLVPRFEHLIENCEAAPGNIRFELKYGESLSDRELCQRAARRGFSWESGKVYWKPAQVEERVERHTGRRGVSPPSAGR